jgi:hypothetical protein
MGIERAALSRGSSFAGELLGDLYMDQIEFPPEVPGAEELVRWFGYWPSFHDAEVIRISLNREGISRLEVRTVETNGELDANGHFANVREAVVCFELESIGALDLHDFNHQNVVFGIGLKKLRQGYELTLQPCYGVAGAIVAETVRVSYEPVAPTPSMQPSV